jgi:hypothetical protein
MSVYLTGLSEGIAVLVWAGDVDALNEVAGCVCCCHEHTFTTGCPAYAWGGCRGQSTMTREVVESWAAHYAKYHGMSRNTFFGVEDFEA